MSDEEPAFAARVAIIGLGLIGGSIARDLAARGVSVVGHDRDPGAVHDALMSGVIEASFDESYEGAAPDVVLLAVPVTAASAVLQRYAKACRAARLVTDVGSTKGAILAAAADAGVQAQFVGSHPLTGDHRSGWTASRTGRFVGARVFLCPAEKAEATAIDLASSLWRLVGAAPELIRAEEHDALVAWSSHLPQFVVCALASTLYEAGVARSELGPGGRDTTRLAGSSPDMWTAIADENRDALTHALDGFQARLRAIQTALANHDHESIRSHLEIAREWFDGSSIPKRPVRPPAV
ncbi:MAG: prephenate dehydrogenase [Gemmatimonadaceae bacterium]